MLTLLSENSLFDLMVKVVGNLNIDNHHMIEDIGIVFGLALKQAVGGSHNH